MSVMSSGSSELQSADGGGAGIQRTPCPLHGCKRVYSNTSALQSHVKEHEIPAQSVPGKVLLCSSVGCSGSFPDMQTLMEHMRHHHKPNIFFLCESCRTKLRSYRGLLTHLHTCSKVPRGKAKPAEPAAPPPAAVTGADMAEQNPPWQQASSQLPDRGASVPASAPQPDPAAPPPFLSHPDTYPPPQLKEAVPQPWSLNTDDPSADALGQNQTQSGSPEPVQPAPVSASHSPPGSSAVWKKSPGVACNRRILWEHTRGRYTCVQCGHTSTNRKDMTQHINGQHGGNKPAEYS